MTEKQFIIEQIRDGYDRAPDDYKPGDDWDDGAGRIADAILAHREPRPIEDEIGDLIDRLAAMTPDECRAIDPRIWARLKIYIPGASEDDT
jgi:hypothetical protein